MSGENKANDASQEKPDLTDTQKNVRKYLSLAFVGDMILFPVIGFGFFEAPTNFIVAGTGVFCGLIGLLYVKKGLFDKGSGGRQTFENK
jgi:hypothetical protein